MNAKPVLGLTLGDPAGIGPEICLRAMSDPAVRRICTPVLFGDAAVLERLQHFILAHLGDPEAILVLEKARQGLTIRSAVNGGPVCVLGRHIVELHTVDTPRLA